MSARPTAAVRYVRLPVFCSLTGYTEKAVRLKLDRGQWVEGRHYRKAPDGHVMMDIEGYERWVESGQAA